MARRSRTTKLPAPFLRRISIRTDVLPLPQTYPCDLPWLDEGFELEFDQPVTIFCGENGAGKSTLIEAIADICGFSDTGGNRSVAAAGHDYQDEVNGAALGQALRGSWLPKVTSGWFFRAETFFSMARRLDGLGSPNADFLSHSHGEGFLRFFEKRMSRQGIYLFDEPESALSPRRQIELLRFLVDVQNHAGAQVILSTHSPILMATPGADLRTITHRGIFPTSFRDTEHFKLYQSFALDPEGFLAAALEGDWDAIV
ncbi:AAA family ATPase [Aliiroseovarius sp. KMU-50]|uniref:AAA family ATPase n=1 Tax=Aliiroseovarius salicola TaxID=3009082 RepID=A0ABT4VYK6_9RHOB|nr:AAA family ATPase [Aliiroseovarius sp. KMU-50]MDA5093346.1 AAA family ATPase [Aliiroseovarius sp. KMU-50]